MEQRLPRRRGIWILLQGIFDVLRFAGTLSMPPMYGNRDYPSIYDNLLIGTGQHRGFGGGWHHVGRPDVQDVAASEAVRDGTIGRFREMLYYYRQHYETRGVEGQKWMIDQWQAAAVRNGGEGVASASSEAARSILAYRLMILLRRFIQQQRWVLRGAARGWLVRIADWVHVLEVLFEEAKGRWTRVVFDRLSEEELSVEIDQAVAMISSISKAVSGLDDGMVTEGVSGQQFMRHVESSWTRLDDAATRAVVNNDGEFLGYLTEQYVGREASYKFGFNDWMRGGLQPQLEGGLEVCWAHMNCGGERLQGPPEPWEGDRLYVDVTVQLCEDLDSLRLREALAECCKHSTMVRYRWRYGWSPFGPVKQEFAARTRGRPIAVLSRSGTIRSAPRRRELLRDAGNNVSTIIEEYSSGRRRPSDA